jgi:hypothetical protein
MKKWVKDKSMSKEQRKQERKNKKEKDKEMMLKTADDERQKLFSQGENIVHAYDFLRNHIPESRMIKEAEKSIVITPVTQLDRLNSSRSEDIAYRKRWEQNETLRKKPFRKSIDVSPIMSSQYSFFNCNAKFLPKKPSGSFLDEAPGYAIIIDMRDKSLHDIGKMMQTKKGVYALAPFIIKGIAKDPSRTKYSHLQPETEERGGVNNIIFVKSIFYENSAPYSEQILGAYSALLKNLKDARVNDALEYYSKNNGEKFQKSFDNLDHKEVTKVITHIFDSRASSPDIDKYIESKYPDMVSEIGRKSIKQDQYKD